MSLLIQHDGNTTGPYPRDQVAAMLLSGELNSNDLASVEGSGRWVPLKLLVTTENGSNTAPDPGVAPAPAPADILAFQVPRHVLKRARVRFALCYSMLFFVSGTGFLLGLYRLEDGSVQTGGNLAATADGASIMFIGSVLFLVLAVFVLARSKMALGIAMSLYALESLALLILLFASESPSRGLLVLAATFFRILVLVSLGVGWGAIDILNKFERARSNIGVPDLPQNHRPEEF